MPTARLSVPEDPPDPTNIIDADQQIAEQAADPQKRASQINQNQPARQRALNIVCQTNPKPEKQDELWLNAGLRDVLWQDIDLKSFRTPSIYMRVRWVLSLIFTATYFFDYATDGLMLWVLIQRHWHDKRWLPLLYIATILLSLVLYFIDMKHTLKIWRSGDVSDSFMNAEALRFATFNFSKYCIVFKVFHRYKYMDKVIKWMERAMRTWPRILLVDLAQLGISMYALDVYEDFSTLEDVERQSLHNRTFATYILKIVVLGWQVGWLLVALVSYPCIRLYIAKELRKKCRLRKSDHVSIRKFITWRIDYRINQILGLVADPKHPERQPVVMITDEKGERRRMRIDELLAQQAMELGQRFGDPPTPTVRANGVIRSPPPSQKNGHAATIDIHPSMSTTMTVDSEHKTPSTPAVMSSPVSQNRSLSWIAMRSPVISRYDAAMFRVIQPSNTHHIMYTTNMTTAAIAPTAVTVPVGATGAPAAVPVPPTTPTTLDNTNDCKSHTLTIHPPVPSDTSSVSSENHQITQASS